MNPSGSGCLSVTCLDVTSRLHQQPKEPRSEGLRRDGGAPPRQRAPAKESKRARLVAMEPRAVHHVSINVDNVEAAVRFYVDVLGLVPRDDRPDFGFGGAWLDAGAQQVHLIE